MHLGANYHLLFMITGAALTHSGIQERQCQFEVSRSTHDDVNYSASEDRIQTGSYVVQTQTERHCYSLVGEVDW